MDLLKRLRRKGFARNQKATVFQSLKGILGIYTQAALHCDPFSLYIGYTILSIVPVNRTCRQMGILSPLVHIGYTILSPPVP